MMAELVAEGGCELGLVVDQGEQAARDKHVSARQGMGIGYRLVEHEEAIAAAASSASRHQPLADAIDDRPAAPATDRPARPRARSSRGSVAAPRAPRGRWLRRIAGRRAGAGCRTKQREEREKTAENHCPSSSPAYALSARRPHQQCGEAGTEAAAVAVIQAEIACRVLRPLFAPTCSRKSRPTPAACWRVDGRHTIYWEQSGNPEGVPVRVPARRPGRRLGAGASPLLRSAVLPHRRVRPARLRPLDAAGELHDNTTGASRGRHGEAERRISASSAGCCSAARGAARWRWPTAWPSRARDGLHPARHLPRRAVGDRLVPARHARRSSPRPGAIRRAPAGARARRSAGQLLSPADRPQSRRPSSGGARLEPLRSGLLDALSDGPRAASSPTMAASPSRCRASRRTTSPTAPSCPKAGRGPISAASAHLPCTIVQGRYDIVCPPVTADALARAWPEAALCRSCPTPATARSSPASARRWSTPPKASACRSTDDICSRRASPGKHLRRARCPSTCRPSRPAPPPGTARRWPSAPIG